MAFRTLVGFGGLTAVSTSPLFAKLFNGGAVLQRDSTVAIWGTTDGTGPVTLYLDGVHAAEASVDKFGNWTAALAPQKVAFDNTLTAVSTAGNTSVTVNFGDVVLCSGQSNMGMPVVGRTDGAFSADDGPAEAARSSKYTGGIWLWQQSQNDKTDSWAEASPETLVKPGFSAVCWYTGKNYYENLGGKVPVGLFEAAVGGSPIEYWLSTESIAKCETDEPQCDDKWPDSAFYDNQIVALQPYTVGAIVWDQAERDLKCNNVANYPCLQRELAHSWRKAFGSPDAAFVAVQLPDYYDQKDPGAPGVPGYSTTAEGVFAMRLAQEAGLEGVEKSALVATYDQSCNNLAFPDDCPFSSVHNVHKQEVGARAAMQLHRLMQGEDLVTEGPRAQKASAKPVGSDASGGFSVSITFAGGSAPFTLLPTRNCTDCCDGDYGAAAKGDFDVSIDGKAWTQGSNARVKNDEGVVIHVKGLSSPPAFVRYTAGSNFTQCALFNAEGLPALPFQIGIDQETDMVVV
jgi:hypothetical protein